MSLLKAGKYLGVAYLVMLALFLISVIGVSFIPREKIRKKCQESSCIISSEGAYYDFLLGHPRLSLDNFTDALMINVAITADDKHPIASAMKMSYQYDWIGMPESLAKIVNGESADISVVEYPRYWHGYQVFLRPLLTRYNLNGIRTIYGFVIWSLVILLLFTLCRKTDSGAALILIFTLFIYLYPMVPFSMQYSTCFVIAMTSALAILLFPKLAGDNLKMATTFFCIGGVTAFLDLLTTPLVTLGLPLVVALLLGRQNETRRVFVGMTAWGGGYALLWLSKWILGSLLIGRNIIKDALEAAQLRTSNFMECNYDYALPADEFRMILLCVVIVLWVSVIACYKVKRIKTEYNWLLIIVMLAPTWHVALFNHSLVHYWFTWRLTMPSVAALLLYIYFIIKKLRNDNSSSHSLLQREQNDCQGSC